LQHLEKAGIAGFFFATTAVRVRSTSGGLRVLRSRWGARLNRRLSARVSTAHAFIDAGHKVKTADVESVLIKPLRCKSPKMLSSDSEREQVRVFALVCARYGVDNKARSEET
jgi:hypothetical protein